MILKMNLEIETEGMTLIQLAATVDAIKHLSGLKGRVMCKLPRSGRVIDVDELVPKFQAVDDLQLDELLPVAR